MSGLKEPLTVQEGIFLARGINNLQHSLMLLANAVDLPADKLTEFSESMSAVSAQLAALLSSLDERFKQP